MRRWLPVLALLAGLGSSFSIAQSGIVDCVGQPTVHVAHLRGSVFDPSGVVIPNIGLTATHGGTVVAQAASDRDGHFDIKLPSGNYELSVQAKDFRAILLTVHVGIGLRSLIHRGQLRWILELTGMNCSWATTSASAFDQEIRVFNERLKQETQTSLVQR